MPHGPVKKALKTISYAVVLFSSLFLFSCSTLQSSIRAKGSPGHYQMTATAADETELTHGATKKANEFCSKKGKEAVVLDQKVKDQSLLKNKTATKVADSLAFHSGAYVGFRSGDDYKLTMDFKCR